MDEDEVALTTFVRETCKVSLDVLVPFTWQPEETIQALIDQCIERFPTYCNAELARIKIRNYLKNCRKTEQRKSSGGRGKKDPQGNPPESHGEYQPDGEDNADFKEIKQENEAGISTPEHTNGNDMAQDTSMAGPGSPAANNDQTEEVEQEEVDPQQAEMNKFLRETCKARLDITTPLTWQPVDDIRRIVGDCLDKFPDLDTDRDSIKKRIGAILKQCKKSYMRALKKEEERKKEPVEQTVADALTAYVRETCKTSIDCQVPLTWQPEDKIQVIVEQCVNQFPEICTHELAKKKIGRFLKNCRKTEYRKSVGRKRPGQSSAVDAEGQPLKKKKKKAKVKVKVEEPVYEGPWAVLSFKEFQWYLCPECDFKSRSQLKFIEHCYEYHPESVKYICMLEQENENQDFFAEDGTDLGGDEENIFFDDNRDDDDFDDGGSNWNANAIVEIKEEKKELTFGKPGADDFPKLPLPKEMAPDQSIKMDEDGKVEAKKSAPPPIMPPKVKMESPVAPVGAPPKKPDPNIKCNQCPQLEFNNKFWLHKHMSTVHGIKIEHNCPQCQSTFLTPKSLQTHIDTVHLEKKLKYPCHMCSKSFPDRYKLERHIEGVHENARNYVCDRCPKSFSVLAMLKRHVDHVHENIRPHRCDVCGKGFFEAADLRSHKLVVHENIKEWHCDQCPKSFGYKRELIKHVGHIHSEHKYKCEQCDKMFPFSYILNRHVTQVHQGLKRHQCDRCDKTFVTPSHLKRHILSIHDNVKDEVCHICQKAFAVRYNLIAHIKKVHKVSDADVEQQFKGMESAGPMA